MHARLAVSPPLWEKLALMQGLRPRTPTLAAWQEGWLAIPPASQRIAMLQQSRVRSHALAATRP